MQALRNVLNYLRHLSSSKLLVGGLFAVAVMATGGVLLSQQIGKAEAATCRENDIIRCGVSNRSDFVNKYNQNVTKDLPAIYSHYGINASEVGSRAVAGTAHKDGTIRVNGKVVATNASSLGRNPQSFSNPVKIGSDTYHASKNSQIFQSESLAALVVMNGEQFKYAIINSCANPAWGTPNGNPPSYKCTSLDKAKVNRTTFKFTAKGEAAGGAKIVGYEFTLGDGTVKRTTEPTYTHDYGKVGSWRATVKVIVSVDGKEQKVGGDHCFEEVNVPAEPKYECTSLTSVIVTPGERKYRFTTNYVAEGGATLKSADINFGDGTTAENLQPTTDTTVVAEHTYGKMGDYEIVATLHFDVNGKVEDRKCKTNLNVPEKPCVDTPEKPECNPCPENPSVPAGSPECNPPAELPKTGPAEIIGGTVALGSLAGAGYYFRSSRRNLIQGLLNK